MRSAFSAFFIILALAAEAGAADRATGDWGGRRTRLADAGIDIAVDYIGESYVLDGGDDISYLGDLDVYLTFDTEKLHAWRGGTIFVYGENNHGTGLSDRLGLLMPQSNLEAEPFTQLSEFWFARTRGIVPNHLLTSDVAQFPEAMRAHAALLDGRSMLVRRTEPLPIE